MTKGQGSTEYLLLIAGAILVAVVVLFMLSSIAPAGEAILNSSVQTFEQTISTDNQNLLGGGQNNNPSPDTSSCGDNQITGIETCDVDFLGTTFFGNTTCASFGYDSGWLECTGCNIDSGNCYNKFKSSSGGGGGGGGGSSGGSGGGIPGGGDVCGDTLITGSETCDVSGNNGCSPGLGCNNCTSCSLPFSQVCGNGIIENGEVCELTGVSGCSGTDTCSSCTQCIADTTSPSISTFSITPGDGQASIQFTSVDPNPPANPVTSKLARSTTWSDIQNMTVSQFDNPPVGINIVFSGGNIESIVDGPLVNGQIIYYRLRACDSATPTPNCTLSTTLSTTPAAGSQSDITPPTIDLFSLTPSDASIDVDLSATDPAPASDPVQYIIIQGTSFNEVDTLPVKGTVSFDNPPATISVIYSNNHASGSNIRITDSQLTNQTTYYYRVRTCDAALPISNCSTSLTLGATPNSVPDTESPVIDSFTLLKGDARATITYLGHDLPVPSTLSYFIARSTDASAVTLLSNMSATGTTNSFDNPPAGVTIVHSTNTSGSWVDTPLTNGIQHYYRIRVCDSATPLNCTLSIIKTVVPASNPNIETTPPSISLSTNWDNALVTSTFSVSDDSSYPVSYYLFRSRSSTAINQIVVTSPNNMTIPIGVDTLISSTTATALTNQNYYDDQVVNGTTYYYRLAACDSASTSNCIISLASSETPKIPQLIFTHGTEETVFDWSSSPKCGIDDYPDLPAHAIWNNNEIILTSAHTENYFWKGTSFNNLQKDCTNVLSSTGSGNPADFDDDEWLNTLYSDGVIIHGIIHMEYHDHTAPCYPNGSTTCWYSGVTYASAPASSSINFTSPSIPNHIVAAPPESWSLSTMNGSVYGYISPTNIIQKDNFYYLFFLADQHAGSTPGGMCIIRTDDLSNPSSWMAWSGSLTNPQFDIPLNPAYLYPSKSPIVGPTHAPCAYLPNVQSLRSSITWNTYLNKYMLMGAGGWINGGNECGAYYALSDDLINWTPIQKIKALDLPFGQAGEPNCLGSWVSGATFNMYPSLIDHSATTINFEDSGQTPHLYWTRINNYLGAGNPNGNDRDLVRQQVTLCLENDPEYPNCTP
ncbi:MAG: class III signal peptide-containing protein [Candidatus Diapherotrites archaeon]|uniref:Class III signal peptide-containing protein n=1 Tax=Candidatus Iainarchaeum sp. TaxID=3101447 RepID=A0A8T4C5Y3_9ARCH|nr:class III signal peptide-containing protein [Candidatus Diapherotrites archaeon]